MKTIAFTKVRLEFGWLGNMAPYPVIYLGKEWRTTEALFQAMRFNDLEIQEAIRLEKSPMGAKLKAKSFMNKIKETDDLSKIAVENLSEQDVKNMEICLRLKLKYHPHLATLLSETGTSLIIEDCTARGKKGTNLFWGAVLEPTGEWIGENTLGNLWMKIRKEL